MKKQLLIIISLSVMLFSASAEKAINLNRTLSEVKVSFKGEKPERIQAVNFLNEKESGVQKVSSADAINTFPYIESFETGSEWIISDPNGASASSPMKIGALRDLNAITGDQYLISGYSASGRNAWAFSPAVALEAETQYYIYINVYVPGWEGDFDEFKITVGSGQTAELQTTVLIDKMGANAAEYPEWTLLSAPFTPTENGTYYFAINHYTAIEVNAVAFEDFVVSEGEYIFPPKASIEVYSEGSMWSFLSDNVYATSAEPFFYFPTVTNAKDTAWTFDNSAENINFFRDGIIGLTYSSEGEHTATLNVTGLDDLPYNFGHTLNIVDFNNMKEEDVVSNIAPTEGLSIPGFTNYNYIFGPNSNFKNIAEYYYVPKNTTLALSQIYFYVGEYKLQTATANQNFTIRLFKATEDGKVGDLITSFTQTYASVFGNAAITSGAFKFYALENPVDITGSFYIAIDFSTITQNANNYLGLVSSQSGSAIRNIMLGYSTAYAYYDNQWVNTINLLQNGAFSSTIMPTLKAKSNATSVNNIESVKTQIFESNSSIHIVNANAGDKATVYTLAGAEIYNQVLNTENTVLPVKLESGLYIVKVGNEVSKIMIK